MHSIKKLDDGSFSIVGKFTTPVVFDSIGDEFIYNISNIQDLIKFTKYSEDTIGINNTRLLERYWRMSYDDCHWSDWNSLPLFDYNTDDEFRAGIFPLFPVEGDSGEGINMTELNPGMDYQLEIKWVRTGTNSSGNILLTNFLIEGLWDRNELTSPVATITPDNYRNPVYIKVKDIFKVFRLDNFEVIVSNVTQNRNILIEYRISQDNWRSSTPWEELTTANISSAMKTHKISPIRFFWIEYRVFRTGDDLTNLIKLHDINLVGDFQNISEDYTKTNLAGIRECCSGGNFSLLALNEGNGIPGFTKNINDAIKTNSSVDTDCLPENLANPMSNQALANLWNPYELNKAVDLYNSLSNSTNEMFGWEVVYFLTDPDKKGTDHTFHEHQLKSVVDENTIKLTVDQNQFPDNQITFNQFDLSLFETFEVHVTKDVFKRAFGVDQRPTRDDFLWFCELNRMYQIEHAQPYRDFNNAAVYYKIILKKYTQKASVQPANETISNRIEELTKNTTLDELFGIEMKDDKVRVANKDQHSPLTKDKVRHEFSAEIGRELVQNSTLVINKYHYNLSNILESNIAVRYSKVDNYVSDGDNRGYSAWFNIPEYVVNEKYNFIQNHDGTKGYKVDILNGQLHLTFNNDVYSMPISINDNVWYCLVVNIDQRQRKVNMYLYQRDVDVESDAPRLKTSKLRSLKTQEFDLSIGGFEFDNTNDIVIYGSNMKLTNIRIYKDVLPLGSHTKVLNQNIIRDSDYLVLADNSNRKVLLQNYGYN